MEEIISLPLMYIWSLVLGFILAVIGYNFHKVTTYFEDAFHKKKLGLSDKEYKRHKNLEKRLYHERYGPYGDTEEYLKVIKQLKICGWDDEEIEGIIEGGKELGYDRVRFTEYMRGFVKENNEAEEEKWIHIRNKNIMK